MPGLTHDLTAARAHHIIDALAAAHLATLTDKGYRGAGPPVHAFAQLKQWRILRRYRGSPTTVGTLVPAILVLQDHGNHDGKGSQ